MKPATISTLRAELKERQPKELLELCLKLAKFKQENKELLTYLLYEADQEESYIRQTNEEVAAMFEEINSRSYYMIRKKCRKILRYCKKHIRYSKKKTTEADILLHFCHQLIKMQPSFKKSTQLQKMFEQQVRMIQKAVAKLHEDLQYDYQLELETLGYAYRAR